MPQFTEEVLPQERLSERIAEEAAGVPLSTKKEMAEAAKLSPQEHIHDEIPKALKLIPQERSPERAQVHPASGLNEWSPQKEARARSIDTTLAQLSARSVPPIQEPREFLGPLALAFFNLRRPRRPVEFTVVDGVFCSFVCHPRVTKQAAHCPHR